MRPIQTVLLLVLAILLQACGSGVPSEIKQAYAELPAELDFNADVKPILSDKCFACHGPDKGKIKAGLQLHAAEFALAELPDSPGKHAIVPGNLAKSEAFQRMMSQNPETIMPPPESHLKLSDREKAILAKWIKAGAQYEPHWAFLAAKPQKPPKVKRPDWLKNEIDNFVLARLEVQGLQPSKEAEKAMLLRRLSLDLTGLPPTEAEIDAFLLDDSENAYEKQVDRLLASPHYGEKMAIDWMDLARFADTHGYQVDQYRDMSPWRDWVIASFNKNRPYDEFVTWQLAGDLLPNATREQRLATGFNRVHQQNMEGGIIDEEFRVEYVADRAAVLGTGLMAMTVACSRCHDHKYDPISQKEYYELYSFFNNVNESGQISWDEKDMPVPTMLIPTEQQEKILAFLQEQVEAQEKSVAQIKLDEQAAFDNWLTEEKYQSFSPNKLKTGLTARFDLDGSLKNQKAAKPGKMKRVHSKKELPTFTEGKNGQGLLLDGDAYLDLKPVGVYDRSESFSIGLWVNIPKGLQEGVIFHKCEGAKLYNFKGYHLYLKDNKLELMLAHTAPDNAITEISVQEVPKEQWVHLALTYDGSSKAAGLKLYLNGKEAETEIESDNLYKSILLGRKPKREPGLKIGARWRGLGIKGAKVDEIQVFDRELTALEVLGIVDPEQTKGILAKSHAELSEDEKKQLEALYFAHFSPKSRDAQTALVQARTVYADSVEQVQEIMVMKEMPEPRQAYILDRGFYDAHGEEVYPNTPSTILPYPEDYPKNRLGLAKWLFLPEHPLTARVAVNRYWQNLFGRGIVRTSEDFGNQGELPSHPKLLDWLAIYFRESGWDVKALHKLMVMSATYRQQSTPSPELKEIDHDNTWLARGPSSRLTSEMMRDNALSASGLLSKKLGGESVNPYQPAGLWSMNKGNYEQSEGDGLYRRSLYTIWKRTVPHPTQATFDQPERSECTVRRQKTNTPLQALVLLNDPTFVEASKKIGEHITRADDSKVAISQAFKRLTGREVYEEELAILLNLQQAEYKKMLADTERAQGWLSAGVYEIDDSLDPNLVAANAIVASAIMNSDASITKR